MPNARDRARPVVRRRRKDSDKPPLPAILQSIVDQAKERHLRRHANPGVSVEIEKLDPQAYVLTSPHSDYDAWQAMICDALGTRSDATARTFLYQLSELCAQVWLANEDGSASGEWCPSETELNLIVNMVAGIKPRNELQAALAAQMVAVHLMTMKASAHALRHGLLDERTAAIAGKLARTFVMQTDALSRMKGRKSSSRQSIAVTHEKHIHHHQHVHVDGGAGKSEHQPCEPKPDMASENRVDEGRAPLSRPDAPGVVVPMSGHAGKAALPDSRRGKRGSAQG